VLGREEALRLGLALHGLEEGRGHVTLEEAVPVLREHGRIPDGVIHAQADEPAEQEVVVELLRELALAPDAVEGFRSSARRSYSGWMEGRPVWEYSRAKRGERAIRAWSTIARIGRSG